MALIRVRQRLWRQPVLASMQSCACQKKGRPACNNLQTTATSIVKQAVFPHHPPHGK